MTNDEAKEMAVVFTSDQELADAKALVAELRQKNIDLQMQAGMFKNAYLVTKGHAAKYLAELVYHRIVHKTALPANLLAEVLPYLEGFEVGSPHALDPEELAQTIRITMPRKIGGNAQG